MGDTIYSLDKDKIWFTHIQLSFCWYFFYITCSVYFSLASNKNKSKETFWSKFYHRWICSSFGKDQHSTGTNSVSGFNCFPTNITTKIRVNKCFLRFLQSLEAISGWFLSCKDTLAAGEKRLPPIGASNIKYSLCGHFCRRAFKSLSTSGQAGNF